jgi:hypothetical protein
LSLACHGATGADSVETLALWTGMLDADFDVACCPELVAGWSSLPALRTGVQLRRRSVMADRNSG